MRPGVPEVHISDRHDAEVAEYHALAGQSVLGLFFGLLAPLAMVDPMLWAIPMLGAFLNVWAIRRIKNNAPLMVGRKMALAGLTLSLLFAAAAPADWFAYRWMIGNEARQFSTSWLRYLTQDEPQKAFQLTLPPQMRQPPDDSLWHFYRDTPSLRRELEGYVKGPLVHSLLALGPKARVRFYRTAGIAREDGNDVIEQLYAVTYEEASQRKSFFVIVRMQRVTLKDGRAEWRILRTQGGVRPEGW
jgi:hypothetical protein